MNYQRIISSTEFERLQRSAQSGPSKSPSSQSMKSLSVARVSKWTNTIEASRHQVTIDRERRLRKEEEERRKVDMEEAGIQFAERKAVIERASDMLTVDNERTRVLNSALMLSDILSERDNQMRIKSHLNQLESLRNTKYDQLIKHNFAEMVRREAREAHEARVRRVDTALEQKAQIEEVAQKYRDEIHDKTAERHEITQRAIHDQNKDLHKKQYAKESARKAFIESQQMYEFMDDMRLRDDTLAEAELEEIHEYAKRRNIMKAKIKERQQQLINKRIQTRGALAETGPNHETTHDPETAATSLPLPVNLDRKLLMQRMLDSITKENQRRVEQNQERIISTIQAKADSLDDVDQLAQDLKNLHISEKKRKACIRKEVCNDMKNQIRLKNATHTERVTDDIAPYTKVDNEGLEFKKHVEDAIKAYATECKHIAPLVIAERKYRHNPDM